MARLFCLLLLLPIISCSSDSTETEEYTPDNVKNQTEIDTSKIVVFSEKRYTDHFLDSCTTTDLSIDELNQLEEILEQICSENEQLNGLEVYHRQYVPGISTDNHKLVWINCFCYQEVVYDKWKEGVITVREGAPCHFYVTVDLTSKVWFDLELNDVHSVHEKRSTT
ncbi:MAG: hypothetical protein H6582_01115 [Crocinitomicaceae bacterium]|nr:hypothetical protein [Crocinitomicaceae bacterium]